MKPRDLCEGDILEATSREELDAVFVFQFDHWNIGYIYAIPGTVRVFIKGQLVNQDSSILEPTAYSVHKYRWVVLIRNGTVPLLNPPERAILRVYELNESV